MRVPQVSERIKEAPAQALRGVFAGIGQLLLITDKIRHKTPADQDVPRARTPEPAETITDTPVTSPAGSPGETAAAAPAEPVTAESAAAAEPVTEPAEATPDEVALAEAAAPVEAALAGEAAPAKPAARRTAAKPATAEPAAAKRSPAKPAAAKPATAKPATKPAATRRAAKPAADAEAAEAPKRQSTRNFDKTGNVRVLPEQADGSPAVSAPEPATAAEPVAAEPVAAPEAVAAGEPAAAAEPVAAPEAVAAAAGAGPLPNYDALTVASLRARLRSLDIAQVRQLAEYERAHAGREDVLGMYERRIAKLEAEARQAGAPEAGA